MLGKATKFLVEKLFTSEAISQKPHRGGKHPLPVPLRAKYPKSSHNFKFGCQALLEIFLNI